MRSPADVAESEEAERRFLIANAASPEAPDTAVNRLANVLLVNGLKVGASHLRVRDGDGGVAEERHGGAWRETTSIPSKLTTRLLWRLKEMGGVEPGVAARCGARVRLLLGRSEGPSTPCDFDVTFARTPAGAAIVLAVIAVKEPAVAPLDGRAQALWDEAEARLDLGVAAGERGEHDAVRRALREAAFAADALGEGLEGRSAQLLRRAASIARSVGLEGDAIDLLEQWLRVRARSGHVDPVEVADVELGLGAALEELERFDAAQPHFERALDAAEAMGSDNGLVVLALSAVARGCARGGDPARAERLLERAEAVAEVLMGADSAFLMPRLELARLRRARDPAEAAASLRRILALAESFGDAPMTEKALGELAEAELARGAVDEASDLLRRALSLAGRHPRALRVHAMLARVLVGRDRRSEALAVLRAGAEIARACRAPEHPDRVALEGELALAERASPYR